MSLENISISGVYCQITIKFGMKVGLLTLITGKKIMLDYLGNSCHQMAFSETLDLSTGKLENIKKMKCGIETGYQGNDFCCHRNQNISVSLPDMDQI